MTTLDERVMLREALTMANVTENVARRYCEELIAASRDVVGASKRQDQATRDLATALRKLEELVGAP